MIESHAATRYVPVCDDCGWRGYSATRSTMAESQLALHKCGEHRQQHDSSGGFRGILGGWNVYCVCGARYVTEDPSAPFACPNDKPQPIHKQSGETNGDQ